MRRAAAVVGIPLLAAGLAAAAPARPAAGDLDRAFGRGGVAVLAMGDATGPGGLARRDNGEIVLLGAVRCGIECQDLTLLALAPDGRARLRGGARFAASTVPAAALALGAGRLTAAGELSSQTLGSGPGAMRFDLGLRPDPGFAGGAAVVARVPAPALLSRFTSVVAPPDGRVVGAGDCRRALPAGGTAGCLLLVGLTPAGDPDLAFGAAATPGATISSAVTRGGTPARTVRAGAALRLPDGRIVQGATVGFGGGRRVAVARYRASGIPDPAWGPGGLRVTDIPGSRSEGASAVAADGAGRIVAAGAAAVGGRRRIALVRHRPGGALDPAFGRRGIATPDLPGVASEEAVAVVAGRDGRLWVAGTARIGGRNRMIVAGYRADGRVDPRFGEGGVALIDLPGPAAQDARATHLVAAGPRRLLVAGSRRLARSPDRVDFVVARVAR